MANNTNSNPLFLPNAKYKQWNIWRRSVVITSIANHHHHSYANERDMVVFSHSSQNVSFPWFVRVSAVWLSTHSAQQWKQAKRHQSVISSRVSWIMMHGIRQSVFRDRVCVCAHLWCHWEFPIISGESQIVGINNNSFGWINTINCHKWDAIVDYGQWDKNLLLN